MYFGHKTCHFIEKIAYWFGGWAGSIGAYKTLCFDNFQQSEYTFLDFFLSVHILGLKLINLLIIIFILYLHILAFFTSKILELSIYF